ncbi:MAG: FtsK/SpoIIIE domain-containing protein [Chloroflexota bacterium]|jgi:hypothetical protein
MAIRKQSEWLEPEEYLEDPDWHDAQRRLEHQIEIQSQQIDQLLARHQVPAGVRGGSVRSHWVSFDLASQLSGSWDKLRRLTGELTGEIASALGVPEVRLERQNGALRLAVKRQEPHPVDLLDLLDLVPEASGLSLALGLDHQGQPVTLNLDQPDLRNILVAGISGAGKSSLMRSIAVSMAMTCRQSLAQMAVIGLGSAPSGITSRPNPLYPVNYLPHLLFPLATEVDEAIEALAYLVEEVAYRADHGIHSPALIIMVDDADMLLRRVGGAVADQLATLLHAPDEAGVRVIVGASNPGLPDLWQMLQHNVDLRLVGRMADERSAQVATGIDESYAQYLDGKGDFIAVSEAGIQPFQAAYIDDYDLHLTLTELHRDSAPVLLAQTLSDEPPLPPAWSGGGDQGFTYDPGKAQARIKPYNDVERRTIEVEDDPGDDWPKSGRQESGRNSFDFAGYGNGLSLPLAPEEIAGPERSAADDGSEPDPPGAVARQAPDDESGEPDESFGEVPYGRSAEDKPAAGPQQFTPQGDDDHDERYEMLPFDEDAPASPLSAEPSAEHEPKQSGAAQASPDASGEKGSRSAAQASGGHIGRRNGLTPGRGQAQAWQGEPVYTDIDDDLWDVPDADDDEWRGRLH